MLFVTHDLELAAATCDRTAVLYAGEMLEEQKSDRLHAAPRHPYTAALLASRPSATRTASRLTVIPGRPVSASAAPAGCAFRPRCRFADEACLEHPQLRMVGEARVRCVHAERIAEALRV
jgi:oligopeptide/dipeptide ABC transporter ATP-binding protein